MTPHIRNWQHRVSACALLGMAFLSACAPEQGMGEPIDEISRALHVSFSSLSLASGVSSKILTNQPLADTACFLGGIAGTLKNTTTALQVSAISDHGNGTYWTVGASTESLNKIIYVNCVQQEALWYTTHYWSSSARDPAPVDMGPASNRICFLNRVDGWYNGNGEQVRTRIANGRWLLDGTWGTLHNYAVGAGATCLLSADDSLWSNEYTLTSGVNGTTNLDTAYDALVGSLDKHVCGITKVSGKFDGVPPEDTVLTRYDSSNPKWWLRATGNASTVSMGVRCLNRIPLPPIP